MNIKVSQNSVATCLRCGGIFSGLVVAQSLLSLLVKNFEDRSLFGEVMRERSVSCFFTRGVDIIDVAFEGCRFVVSGDCCNFFTASVTRLIVGQYLCIISCQACDCVDSFVGCIPRVVWATVLLDNSC